MTIYYGIRMRAGEYVIGYESGTVSTVEGANAHRYARVWNKGEASRILAAIKAKYENDAELFEFHPEPGNGEL
jgi:hypothetical protein